MHLRINCVLTYAAQSTVAAGLEISEVASQSGNQEPLQSCSATKTGARERPPSHHYLMPINKSEKDDCQVCYYKSRMWFGN
ncbi:hypothetical protein F4803DRAFT_507642 [Xylaria telfairii]|nr:hypothetical protein F4803DRAFT_507642 [Xylaria telfairii]